MNALTQFEIRKATRFAKRYASYCIIEPAFAMWHAVDAESWAATVTTWARVEQRDALVRHG